MTSTAAPPAAARPASLRLSASSLRWWAGGFCAFLGSFMVVVPGQFSGPAYAAFGSRVPVWGLAFLVAGWSMLAVAAVRPRQAVHAAAHALVASVFALVAGGLAASGAWSGTVVYGVLSLSMVASALLPPRQRVPPGLRRGDLFALTLGIAMLGVGGGMIVATPAFDPAIYRLADPWLRAVGAVLIASGVPLAAVQLLPAAPRFWSALAHLSAGAVLLATTWVLPLPTHAWTGVVLYGSGGALVAVLPWLRKRLGHFDPASIATLLALSLAAAASLPLTLTLGVVESAAPTATNDAHRLRAFALLVAVVVLAVALALAAARYLARPLRRLAEAADRLAAGEPAVPLGESRISEVDRLSANFRHMRDRLAERSRRADELADELRHRADELAEADRRKDEFLAMLAHELRNPLGAVSNAAHALRDGHCDTATVEQATGVIRRQVRHLGRLVDDLLDMSRITRGKVQLRRCRLDLVEVVRRAVETARPRLESSGLALVVDLPPEPVWVDADATRLEQVLGNLLGNAAQYTPSGGRVAVSVGASEGGGEGGGGAGDGDDSAVVRVADTGVGMPPDLVPRVFDLFAQGERALDRRAGGLGIGLTLVRQLVELHGGRVSAHSDGADRGSRFEVRLPRSAS
jgi:signal transduction histidine kinase